LGEVLEPLGELLGPLGEVLEPLGEVLEPLGEVLKPLGEVLQPLGEVLLQLSFFFFCVIFTDPRSSLKNPGFSLGVPRLSLEVGVEREMEKLI
jgi:hypothetical protein